MSDLERQPLHKLRAIAQGHGIADIFSKTDAQLIQDIQLKQQDMLPKPEVEISRPEYDARLMTKPPSKVSDKVQIEEILREHVARGLHLDFPDEEHWRMRFGKKEDNGTVRMPLRVVLNCADKVMV